MTFDKVQMYSTRFIMRETTPYEIKLWVRDHPIGLVPLFKSMVDRLCFWCVTLLVDLGFGVWD